MGQKVTNMVQGNQENPSLSKKFIQGLIIVIKEVERCIGLPSKPSKNLLVMVIRTWKIYRQMSLICTTCSSRQEWCKCGMMVHGNPWYKVASLLWVSITRVPFTLISMFVSINKRPSYLWVWVKGIGIITFEHCTLTNINT